MAEYDYKGVHVQIETTAVGKRFSWSYETDNCLTGQCDESGTQSEEAAVIEAKSAARLAIDKIRNG